MSGFLNLGCYQHQGVLKSISGVAGEGHVCGSQRWKWYVWGKVLANGRGAGLLKRDQKECWGKRLRNAGLCHITRTLC